MQKAQKNVHIVDLAMTVILGVDPGVSKGVAGRLGEDGFADDFLIVAAGVFAFHGSAQSLFGNAEGA